MGRVSHEGSMAFCISGAKQYRQQRAAFLTGLCICRQHCAVNRINVGKIIRCLRLPQFAVRHIQGGEQSTELSCYYGGMTPPDKLHIYELHVYALDKMLDLGRGFLLNELYREMDGHILDQFTLKGIYEKM